MKRLYRAETTITAYVVAEDRSEAFDAATDALLTEIREGDIETVSPTVTEVHDLSRVSPRWRAMTPYNTPDGEPELTCEEILCGEAD